MSTTSSVISLCFLFAASGLAVGISRRVPRREKKTGIVSRTIVFCLLLQSWAFIVSAAITIVAVRENVTTAGCSVAIVLCLSAYIAFKFTVCLFLIERAHVVFALISRRRNLIRIWDAAILSGWISVAVLLVLYRSSEVDWSTPAKCRIGIGQAATIPGLIVGVLMEISYAGIFIYPLVDIGGLERIKRLVRWNSLPKQHDCVQHSPAIKRLATKSLVATTGSLITSLVNIGILENGAQLHSVCLSSCSLDVLINVGIIYFITCPRRCDDDTTSLDEIPVNTISLDNFDNGAGSPCTPTSIKRSDV